jgi:hypothetical protein
VISKATAPVSRLEDELDVSDELQAVINAELRSTNKKEREKGDILANIRDSFLRNVVQLRRLVDKS